MGIVFRGSPGPTLGVEIELQTVDPTSMALISGAPHILARHLDDVHIKQELLQCCIEVCTAVCHDVAEVERDLRARIAQLLRAGDELGIAFLAAGTHPFSRWAEQEITSDHRYHTQLERTQWTARRLLTFGLHVHVGVASPEKAIALFNAVASYVPHLLALSASSPYWEGLDTGLESVRAKVFENLPGGGLPFRVRTWTEFQRMIRVLQRIGTINSIQELWGDLRPHSKYGTLEVRICDAMPDLEELLAVVALVQALVVWLSDLYDRGTFLEMPRYWVLQENKWRATRWGTRCRMVIDEKGDQQRFRILMEELLEQLAPISEGLGSWEYLQTLQRLLIQGGSAQRQRAIFRETRSLEAVARDLEQQLRAWVRPGDLPGTDLSGPRLEGPRPRSPLERRGLSRRDF